MNIFSRKISFIIFLGLLMMSLLSCSIFRGILYPKIIYSFSPIDPPPDSANVRLDAGGDYPQVFTFWFTQAGNTFRAYFVPTIFVNTPYKVLYVKEMSYDWEGNKGVFLREKSFELPVDSYIVQNGWYWLGGVGDFFNTNFEKIFEDKKPGDKFLFKLALSYSFDDEPEQTQVLEYNVTTMKGEYVSPFMGR